MNTGFELYQYLTYTEEGEDVTPAMVAVAHQQNAISLMLKAGYNIRHAKWMAGRMFPTPAQERMANARRAKKGKK